MIMTQPLQCATIDCRHQITTRRAIFCVRTTYRTNGIARLERGFGKAVNATVVASAAGIFVLDYFVSFIIG